MFSRLNEVELENIKGGNIADGTMYITIITALVVLVSLYKIYSSTKGKTKIGNDYTFEWS